MCQQEKSISSIESSNFQVENTRERDTETWFRAFTHSIYADTIRL